MRTSLTVVVVMVASLALAAQANPDDNVGEPPRNPRVTIGGKNYVFVTSVSQYNNGAALECLRNNGYIASFETSSENAAVKAYIRDPANGLQNYDFWIGLSKLYSETQFSWSNPGDLTYTDWASGQPDIPNGSDDACVYVIGGTGWYDSSCFNSAHYVICEV